MNVYNSGGGSRAYKNYSRMYRMQAAQLQYDKGKEKSSGAYGNQEVLQILQKTHITQRDQVITQVSWCGGEKNGRSNKQS